MQNAELKSIGCGVAHCATYICVFCNAKHRIYYLLFIICYLLFNSLIWE